MLTGKLLSRGVRRAWCHPSETCRLLASSRVIPAVSAYEYPTRTESPDIKITNASEISLDETESTPSTKVYSNDDPFDDQASLNASERQERKATLQSSIENLKLSSFPITGSIPDFIPPNVASTELEESEMFRQKMMD